MGTILDFGSNLALAGMTVLCVTTEEGTHIQLIELLMDDGQGMQNRSAFQLMDDGEGMSRRSIRQSSPSVSIQRRRNVLDVKDVVAILDTFAFVFVGNVQNDLCMLISSLEHNLP